MDKVNYTTINHEARKKLDLTLTEYCVADMIYNLANNPHNNLPGWCYASKEAMGKEMGITKRGINKIIARLIEDKLVERHQDQPSFLRITIDWFNAVIIKREQSSRVGTSVQKGGNKVPGGGNKVHTTIDIYKDNNNSTKVLDKKSYGNEDINHLISFLKEKLKIPILDGSERENRRYAQLAINKFGDVGKVKMVIQVASHDPFWSGNVTSFKQIYYKAVQIVSSQRTKKGVADGSYL